MFAGLLAQYGDALLWLLGCVVIGFVIDQIVFRLLSGRARTRGLRTLSKVAEGLRWAPTAMGVALGAMMAIQRMGLEPAARLTALRWAEAFAILVVTVFSARVVGRFVRAVTSREDVPLPSGSIFVNLARGVTWALGIVSLLGVMGVAVAPLLTALGIGGLAVGLALQPTLENAFSGVQLIASKQIQTGDFIRLSSGEEGTVLDVTWRTTAVRTGSNEVVIVPNSVLARASVTNFSCYDPEFVLVVPVSIASSNDLDLAERVSLEVARGVIADLPEAVAGREPGARFAQLSPPSVTLNVSIRCRSYQERIAVRHELVRRLAKRFAEEKIEAPGATTPGAESAC